MINRVHDMVFRKDSIYPSRISNYKFEEYTEQWIKDGYLLEESSLDDINLAIDHYKFEFTFYFSGIFEFSGLINKLDAIKRTHKYWKNLNKLYKIKKIKNEEKIEYNNKFENDKEVIKKQIKNKLKNGWIKKTEIDNYVFLDKIIDGRIIKTSIYKVK